MNPSWPPNLQIPPFSRPQAAMMPVPPIIHGTQMPLCATPMNPTMGLEAYRPAGVNTEKFDQYLTSKNIPLTQPSGQTGKEFFFQDDTFLSFRERNRANAFRAGYSDWRRGSGRGSKGEVSHVSKPVHSADVQPDLGTASCLSSGLVCHPAAQAAEETAPLVALVENTSLHSRPEIDPTSAQAVEDHTCFICLKMMTAPVSLNCGHRFCWECLDLASSSLKSCPLCNKEQALDPYNHKVDLTLASELNKACNQGGGGVYMDPGSPDNTIPDELDAGSGGTPVLQTDKTRRVDRPASSTTTPNVPAFLRKCFDIASDSQSDWCVKWSASGDSLIILDPSLFAKEILPTNFKHNNLMSFVRQLNKYGFRKRPGNVMEFFHKNFQRDARPLLADIKSTVVNKKTVTATHSHRVRDTYDRLLGNQDSLKKATPPPPASRSEEGEVIAVVPTGRQLRFSVHPSATGVGVGQHAGGCWMYIVLAHEFGNAEILAFHIDGVLCGKIVNRDQKWTLVRMTAAETTELELHTLLPRVFKMWCGTSPPRQPERWICFPTLQDSRGQMPTSNFPDAPVDLDNLQLDSFIDLFEDVDGSVRSSVDSMDL